MRRRELFHGAAAALLARRAPAARPLRTAAALSGAGRCCGSIRPRRLPAPHHRHESVRRHAQQRVRPPLRLRQTRNQPGRRRLGRRHARRQGRRRDACVNDFPRLHRRRRPDAGGAHLAVDVRPQLLPRRPGDRLGHLRHRPGAVGYPRQGARPAGLQTAGRPLRPARRARLLPHQRQNRGGIARLRETAWSTASPASRPALRAITSGSRRTRQDRARREAHRSVCAKGSGPTSTSPSTSTPRPARSVASDHHQGSRAAATCCSSKSRARRKTSRRWRGSRGAPRRRSPPANAWSRPTAAAS